MRLNSTLITVLIVTAALCSIGHAAATKQKAIVKFVTGEVLYQKESKGGWKKVKVGSKIAEDDMVRTFVESNAQLLLESGSQLTIEENTIIKMAELAQDGDATSTNVNIKKGSVLFNVKKLAERKSEFKFETLTATAAIRGTDGGIGFTGRRAFAYLNNGKLELRSPSGKKVDVNPKDFVIQNETGFVVKKMESKEDLKNFLQELVEEAREYKTTEIDPTLTDSVVIDTTATEEDPEPVAETQEAETIALAGTIQSVPPQALVPELSVSGTCTGTEVTIGTQKAAVSNGVWQTLLTWSASEIGERSYDVTCMDKKGSVSLGEIRFKYGVEMSLNLQTPDLVDVKNGALNIRGSYTGSPKAQLFAAAGGKTVDISSKSQYFSYVLAITDKIGNWNLDEVVLTLKDQGQSDIVRKVTVAVDKTSKAVNTTPPKIAALPNPAAGEMMIVITNAKDDIVKYQIRSPEGVVDEETDKDVRYKYMLLAGEHDYEITAVDLAGNEVKQQVAKVQYWPPANFTVDMQSPTANGTERRLPPRMPNLKKRQIPKERVEIRIGNLPNDDYRFIKSVTVENSAASFKEIFENTRLDQNNRYEVDVELAPNKTNVITVKVEPQKGSYKVVTKTIILK